MYSGHTDPVHGPRIWGLRGHTVIKRLYTYVDATVTSNLKIVFPLCYHEVTTKKKPHTIKLMTSHPTQKIMLRGFPSLMVILNTSCTEWVDTSETITLYNEHYKGSIYYQLRYMVVWVGVVVSPLGGRGEVDQELPRVRVRVEEDRS